MRLIIMFLPFLKRKNRIRPVALVIIDGFGMAPASKGNAISLAKTPNYDKYLRVYPHGSLIASGESVGLPANEVGNSEVGHLTLGVGRIILQSLKKIDIAIEKGRFYDNQAFLTAASHVKENNSKFHIMGLVGSGGVHSVLGHLFALLQFCKKEEIENVYLHLFTDGRDSPPEEGIEIVEKIQNRLRDIRLGKIASISGRYYAMDRDRRWDRIEKTYKALVFGRGIQATSAVEAMKESYAKGKTDEFVEPTVIIEGTRNKEQGTRKDQAKPVATISDNDAVIFFNFRVDRPRQLTMAFVLPNFENLKSFDLGHDPVTEKKLDETEIGTTFIREKVLKNLFFVTMTEYQKNLAVSAVAFPPSKAGTSLPQVLSEQGLKQLHLAESEKKRMVTTYFNGLHEGRFQGEDVLIVSSPKVATYDKKPEMSLPKLISEFKKQLRRNRYHFFVINFANPDMVAHSGNLKATVKAVEYVDKYLGELVRAILSVDGTVFVTADHGNAEDLLTFPTSTYFYTTAKGSINTEHSDNPVPLLIISKFFKGQSFRLPQGTLSDVAPTILGLMGIQKPVEMTGRNILAES